MRVAHIIHGLSLGGAQRVAEVIIERTTRDLDHVVYSPSAGVFASKLADAGAAVRIIPRHLPKFDPGWMLRLAAAIRRDEIDLVHMHLFGDSLHGCLAARLAGVDPTVLTLHSMATFHTRLQRLGYRFLLPRVTRAVACSEAVRASFLENVPDAGIETIPNGVDPPKVLDRRDARAKLGCEGDALLVGAVGRLVEEKGLATLIAALAQVVRESVQQVRLVILGEGPLRPTLEAAVREAGLAGVVALPGFRPDAPQLLKAFDVIVVSSVNEGLSMALLEAMAAGRCVVATNVGGNADAVRHRQEGLLVPPRDPSGLAAALRRVVEDPGLRARLGNAAARRFQRRFTADRMAAAYERLYWKIGGRRREAREAAAGSGRR